MSAAELRLADGLFLSVDLERGEEPAGYRARPNAPLLDLARTGEHEGESFWEPIYAAEGRIILQRKSSISSSRANASRSRRGWGPR